MPTNKQIKEFWEKLSPTPDDWRMYEIWLYSGYPPIDLNNLFKYAVPKLDQSRYYKALSSIFYYDAIKEDPALALFWAIYQVIKET
uniref:Uncharacterized protein n=1 Tax=viral metagenome TaxID=1070528 RepID=A0A6M3L2Q5_9ZZZZ